MPLPAYLRGTLGRVIETLETVRWAAQGESFPTDELDEALELLKEWIDA